MLIFKEKSLLLPRIFSNMFWCVKHTDNTSRAIDRLVPYIGQISK